MTRTRLLDTPKKIIFLFLGATIFIALYFLIFDYVNPDTSDAYVDAYTIEIAPQAEGQIVETHVRDNQHVKKGNILFQIEKTSYVYEKSRAESDVVKRKEQSQIAEKFYLEAKALYRGGVISFNKYLERQDSMLNAKALLIEAQARLDTAEYNLSQTTVKAPADGYITHLRVQNGYYAHRGEIQMALVKKDNWWITANFKENNLQRIVPGQTALVSLPMYPGDVFKARVESVGWGVNLQNREPSKYLPYIETTMNWVKLAQRFPVRIRLENSPQNIPLRVGASAVVTVFTTNNDLVNTLSYGFQWLQSLWEYLS